MNLPGLAMYPWTLLRTTEGQDDEFNPVRTLAPVATGQCAFGSATGRDQAYAGAQGERVQAAASMDRRHRGTFRAGDILEVRGQRWRVAAIPPNPLTVRLLLDHPNVDTGLRG